MNDSHEEAKLSLNFRFPRELTAEEVKKLEGAIPQLQSELSKHCPVEKIRRDSEVPNMPPGMIGLLLPHIVGLIIDVGARHAADATLGAVVRKCFSLWWDKHFGSKKRATRKTSKKKTKRRRSRKS